MESEELGGEQMNERPRERTSCSVSVSVFELKLWMPLLVIVLKIGGRRGGGVKLGLGKGALGGGRGVEGD